MSALSVEVRRIVVAHLTDRHMSPARIAAELGVSRETVRRDLLTRPEPVDDQAATGEQPAEAPAETGPAPDTATSVHTRPVGLTLAPSPTLGQDLRLIAAAHKQPAEQVAEELLHTHAQRIRARWQAQLAAS